VYFENSVLWLLHLDNPLLIYQLFLFFAEAFQNSMQVACRLWLKSTLLHFSFVILMLMTLSVIFSYL
jgi:hypothetical protein